MHHSYSVLLGLLKAIERLEASAGLTPVDRSRVKDERSDATDPLERWLACGSGQ
jgi:hypothetical protein